MGGAVLLPLAMTALTTGGLSAAAAKTYTETILHSFDTTDGLNPAGGLARDKAGNLYGTTEAGGANNVGTLFMLSPSGTLTVLWSFTGGTDGANPFAAPILAGRNLYGTTLVGGNNNQQQPGVVYEFNLDTGQLTTLYAFGLHDGWFPRAPLIRDSSGNLYGTTTEGGAGGNSSYGEVFKLSKSGAYTVLYSFTGGADGDTPDAGLILDSAGNLYGTTEGSCECTNPYGSVFKISPTGQETTLYSFTSSGIDRPFGSLAMDPAGNLYGTALVGGDSNLGGLFEISASGQFSTLYQFNGGKPGGNPYAGVLYREGKLFGTTHGDGDGNSNGSVFEFDLATDTIKSLHDFKKLPDGIAPYLGTLVRDSSGNFYGTTLEGGAGSSCQPYGCGTVFEVSRKANGRGAVTGE